MGRYIPRGIQGRNAGIGILLLIFLFILAGPRTLPQFISRFLPVEGACINLRQPSTPDLNQSIIQREASERMTPIRVQVRVSGQRDDGTQQIEVVLTNMTVGTLPVRIPNDPIGNPNGRMDVNNLSDDGVGVLIGGAFTQPAPVNTGAPLATDQVRLLVPQQSCTLTRVFTPGEVNQFGIRGGVGITAYYRNSTAGTINQRTPQSIFPDMGLWVGAVSSAPVAVPAFFSPTATP
ncbi:MAG: hypothetical protein MUF38_17190 [Anaerolineae bacterium]|nr:hypothetical protein [Anaerolineae bacterium]